MKIFDGKKWSLHPDKPTMDINIEGACSHAGEGGAGVSVVNAQIAEVGPIAIVAGEPISGLKFDTTKTADEMVAFFNSLTDWQDMGGIPACLLATIDDGPVLLCAKFDTAYALFVTVDGTACVYATEPFDGSVVELPAVTESGWQNLIGGVWPFEATCALTALYQEELWNGDIIGQSNASGKTYKLTLTMGDESVQDGGEIVMPNSVVNAQIVEAGPIALVPGESISALKFDTSKTAYEMTTFFNSLGDWQDMDGINCCMLATGAEDGDIPLLFVAKFDSAYALIVCPGDLVCVYATEPFDGSDFGLSVTESGWQNLFDGLRAFGEGLIHVYSISYEYLWNGDIAGKSDPSAKTYKLALTMSDESTLDAGEFVVPNQARYQHVITISHQTGPAPDRSLSFVIRDNNPKKYTIERLLSAGVCTLAYGGVMDGESVKQVRYVSFLTNAIDVRGDYVLGTSGGVTGVESVQITDFQVTDSIVDNVFELQ